MLEAYPADRWVQAALDGVNELYKNEECNAARVGEHNEHVEENGKKVKKINQNNILLYIYKKIIQTSRWLENSRLDTQNNAQKENNVTRPQKERANVLFTMVNVKKRTQKPSMQ